MWRRLFQREPRAVHGLEVRPFGWRLEVDARTPLLDAALDAGLPFPHGCREGECGSCLCRVVSGAVDERVDTSGLLTPGQRQSGHVLACQTLARCDVVVEIPPLPAHPLVRTGATVASVRRLTHDIAELTLALDVPLAYTAGQYAELAVPGVVDEGRNYSFAAAPGDAEAVDRLVFHVRHVPGGAFTGWLFGGERAGERLVVTGPHGQFALRHDDGPIVCVAGGSGMAPILALLEQALHDGVARPVTYLFGARARRDLYALDAVARLEREWPAAFDFVPVLSEEPADSDWSGERGLVTEPLAALLRDVQGARGGEAMAAWQAYLCGPPAMLDAALAVLEGAGVAPERTFFDKFTDKRHGPAATPPVC